LGKVDSDLDFMRLALKEAEEAFNEGEVPVGAVLVVHDEIVAAAHNSRESTFDPTNHAEISVLREAAGKIKNWRLTDATLYVTKEPCIMCAGAMVNARLGRLVYGCYDSKGGAVKSLYKLLSDIRLNHQVEVVSGVLEEECADLLKRFFEGIRNKSLNS
jgi:tRNA(adenine34) deaminase